MSLLELHIGRYCDDVLRMTLGLSFADWDKTAQKSTKVSKVC